MAILEFLGGLAGVLILLAIIFVVIVAALAAVVCKCVGSIIKAVKGDKK